MTEERQTQGEGEGRAGSGIDAAEEWGERLGRSLGGLYQSVRNVGEGATGPGRAERSGSESTTERAETLVTQAEQKLGEYAALASYGIRRIAARAKEEYDDIMAEAQAKREAQQQETRQE